MEMICRTCLRTPDDEKLVPLFIDANLVDKIQSIASIQLINGVEYPSTICQECLINVNKLFNFRKVIISSDKELKDRYITLEHSKKQNKSLSSSRNDSKEAVMIKIDVKHEIENENTTTIINNNDNSNDSATTTTINNNPITIKPPDSIGKSLETTLITLRSWQCPICKRTFKSRYQLCNHRRTMHGPRGVCNICGATIRTDNLKRHVQMHTEGLAACRECGKVFKNRESLRGHMRIHRGTVFTCEVCGKQSKVKTEHSRHMKRHSDPELGKAICTLCGKKVRDLRKHMLSHTGERPYLCHYCSKGFTSSYALKVHTRQHTNEKPYICECCSMAFPQKVSLVTHLKSKHNQLKCGI